jgi:hypothetical protein
VATERRSPVDLFAVGLDDDRRFAMSEALADLGASTQAQAETLAVGVMPTTSDVGERHGDLAWVGLCCLALQAIVTGHYQQIAWSIGVPVPIAWSVVAGLAGTLGLPLILVDLGRQTARLVTLPWLTLLRTWVVPAVLAHALWLGAYVLLLRRFDDQLAGVPLGSGHDLLAMLLNPPPGSGLLYALAVFPVLAKLTRTVPGFLLIGGLVAAVVLVSAASLLVFLAMGLRLNGRPFTTSASRTDLVGRAAVAMVGLAVTGVDALPDGLAAVVAGMAALPFVLAVVAPAAGRAPASVRRAAVVGVLMLMPAVAVTNAVLLARLSAAAPPVQLVIAVAGPVAWTAGFLVVTAVVVASGRRIAAVVLGG